MDLGRAGDGVQFHLGNRPSLIIPLLSPAKKPLPHQEAVQRVWN